MDRKTVIQFGHGYMGAIHLDALVNATRVEPSLDIVVVEPWPERRGAAEAALRTAGIDPAGRVFATGPDALQVWNGDHAPFAAVMACFDREHDPMLRLLRDEVPGLRAVFSEKPLTEHVAQARSLEPWLDGLDLVTMNTVIHFSPAIAQFRKLLEPNNHLDGARLVGAEGAWMGNYTSDNRPLIGVRGDALHPLGVASEVLGIGKVEMVSGSGLHGVLNPGAPEYRQIIHELTDSKWRGTESFVPLRLRSSYSGGTQFDAATGGDVNVRERRVIGFYNQKGRMLAAEFNFDLSRDGQTIDTLHLYQLNQMRKPQLLLGYTGYKQDIDIGLAPAHATHDKARAFVGQSLRAALDPENPEHRRHLTTFRQAMDIQVAVDRITPETRQLTLRQVSGPQNASQLSEARMMGTIGNIVHFGDTLAHTPPTEWAQRLGWVRRASTSAIEAHVTATPLRQLAI